jgi:hypothetical protein
MVEVFTHACGGDEEDMATGTSFSIVPSHESFD